jgi:hypothetical protein
VVRPERANGPASADTRESAAPLTLHLPFASRYRTDGFLGAWVPESQPRIREEPGDSGHASVRGQGFHLASPIAAQADGSGSKVHAGADGTGLGFRGYLLDPPLHHFSAPDKLLDFWARAPLGRLNGVFAAAVIDAGGSRLLLYTDALGMAPLYYRIFRGHVLFATKPDWLVAPDSGLDETGAGSLAAAGFPVADRSLVAGVERVPPGTRLCFDRSLTPRVERWHGPEAFPPPETPLDASALRLVEERLDQAIDRCRALAYGPEILPLSSGYDSRRILASLVRRGERPDCITVRVYIKGHRDLDAVYAGEICRRFDCPHSIIELPEPETYSRDDVFRRRETGGETKSHTWVVSMMRALPARPMLLWDGILGDVLGNPGFRLDGLYQDTAADIDRIAGILSHVRHGRYLADALADGEAIASEVRAALAPFAGMRNVAELAFLIMRQRRMTALWSQQLADPHHLVACPYLDLDYMEACMRIRPEDRHRDPLQEACLRAFHPELAGIPGSRRIPAQSQPAALADDRARVAACLRALAAETRALPGDAVRDRLRTVLNRRGRLLVRGALHAPGAAVPFEWVVSTVLNGCLADLRAGPTWEPG